jgi:hypothetical protein
MPVDGSSLSVLSHWLLVECQGSSAVEQGTHKPLVGGSIPPSGTFFPLVVLVIREGVTFQILPRHELKGGDVGAFQPHARSAAGIERLLPAGDAQAPAIAGLQAGKFVLRDGRGEVVALRAAEEQEFGGHFHADGVETDIARAGAAIAIAIKTGDRLEAAGTQAFTEDVGGA